MEEDLEFSSPTPAIRLLNHDTVVRLRSTVNIISLTQCVDELVVNAIDARATNIEVRVDITRFTIHVSDNGHGFSPESLKLAGEPYATSKCSSLNDLNTCTTYGFRGEALASLRDISTLEILSKGQGYKRTHSKLFQRGVCVHCGPSSFPRISVGTTVSVHDLFYNYPVRRKLVEHIELDQICKRLEAIALINPDISIVLRNTAKNQELLRTSRTVSTLAVFRQLYNVQQLPAVEHLVSINYRDYPLTKAQRQGPYGLHGCVSTEGHINKSLQFIYVNKRLLLKTRLHKLINNLLLESSITGISHTNQPSTNTRKSPSFNPYDKRPVASSAIEPHMSKTRKYGIFVFNIVCPPSEVDICLEPSKVLVEFQNWDGIIQCITEAVKEFLKDHDLTTIPTFYGKMPTKNGLTREGSTINSSAIQSKIVGRTSSSHIRGHTQFKRGLVQCSASRTPLLLSATKPTLPYSLISTLSRPLPLSKTMGLDKYNHRTLKKDHCETREKSDLLGKEGNDTVSADIISTGFDPPPSQCPQIQADKTIKEGLRVESECCYIEENAPYISSINSVDNDDIYMNDRDLNMPSEELPDSIFNSKDSFNSSTIPEPLQDTLATNRDIPETPEATLPDLSTTPVKEQMPEAAIGVNRSAALDIISNDIQLTTTGEVEWMETSTIISGQPIYVHMHTGNSYYSRPPAMDVPASSSILEDDSPGLLLRTAEDDAQHNNQQCTTLPADSALISYFDDRILTKHFQVSEDDVPKHDKKMEQRSLIHSCSILDWAQELAPEDYVSVQQPKTDNRFTPVQNIRFKKSMLRNIHVVRQVDNKFIVCCTRTPPIIVLFDQHAAHERVRLKALLDSLTGGTTGKPKLRYFFPPLSLKDVGIVDAQLIEKCSKGFHRWGIHCVVKSIPNPEDPSTQLGGGMVPVLITALPAVIVDGIRPDELPMIAESLIHEHIATLRSTGGSATTLPRIMSRVMNNKACRGAVMFGDTLELEECKNLISDLSKCDLPFQCAHGRPTLIPLLDLDRWANRSKDPPKRLNLAKFHNR